MATFTLFILANMNVFVGRILSPSKTSAVSKNHFSSNFRAIMSSSDIFNLRVKICEAVATHPCLWDKQCKEFVDKTAKTEAIKRIAKACGCDVPSKLTISVSNITMLWTQYSLCAVLIHLFISFTAVNSK